MRNNLIVVHACRQYYQDNNNGAVQKYVYYNHYLPNNTIVTVRTLNNGELKP